MRRNLLHPWAWELSYEIREIVEFAKQIEKLTNKKTIWENIWDPVEKWEEIPTWLKNIVINACKVDRVYWYSPTRWLDKTLEYLANKHPKLKKENILFFNWLWDAINKVYKNLDFSSRVIWPNPAYSTHSSAEAAHAGSEHITYRLDPNNAWNPDLEELENKVKYNPNIVWILVVNPDNPTWAVFKKEVLEKIIQIAKKYNLFVIFDEIYEKLTYDSKDRVLLADIIWDVPWISMKWISKELPWPWARCWWIEVYNKDKDENFSKYIDSILASKMLEVCSTTLPQYVIPEIYENTHFKKSLVDRIEKYKQKAEFAKDFFSDCELVSVVKPKWAFYLSIVFNLDKINQNKQIKTDKKIEKLLNKHLQENSLFDKKFCYYLLIEKQICVVPLSSFNSNFLGFRMTLLENDFKQYKDTLKEIKKFIREFEK